MSFRGKFRQVSDVKQRLMGVTGMTLNKESLTTQLMGGANVLMHA